VALRGRLLDTVQRLHDGPARADVQVANLRVAHLAVGEADSLTGRTERGVGPRREQAAPARHRRGSDGGRRRVMPDAEPIEDDEDDRAGPAHARPAAASSRARAVIPARPTMPA